jgi:hypothetical protein
MDPGSLENRKTQIEYLLQLIQQAAALIPYQTKEEILSFIANSETIMQDLAQMKLFPGKASIINIDYWEPLNQFSRKVKIEEITKMWEILISAEIDLNKVNVNLKAYFEFLCFSLKNIVLFC